VSHIERDAGRRDGRGPAAVSPRVVREKAWCAKRRRTMAEQKGIVESVKGAIAGAKELGIVNGRPIRATQGHPD
jgi:hypothetical protein